MKRIGIVAALEREIAPLLEPGKFGFVRFDSSRTHWENEFMLVECGGIGAKAAAAAAERLLASGEIKLLITAGIAGALTPGAEIGQVMLPSVVLDETSGQRYKTCSRHPGILVTAASVADSAAKQALRQRTGADLVDMEAAAVAAVAAAHQVPFLAVKAISDTLEQRLPPLHRFVREGRFRTPAFLLWAALRPHWWAAILQLGDQTQIAARKLSFALSTLAVTEDWAPDAEPRIVVELK